MKKRILPNGLLFTVPITLICAVLLAIAALFIAGIFVDKIKDFYDVFIIIFAVTAVFMAISLSLRFAFRIRFTADGINYAYWSRRVEKITYREAAVTDLQYLYKGKRCIIFEYTDGKKVTVYVDSFSKKQADEIMERLVSMAKTKGYM